MFRKKVFCNLCGSGPSKQNELVSRYSPEDEELGVCQAVQRLFGNLVNVDAEPSFAICRGCCKIVYDFHQLYVLVERGQKAIANCDYELRASEETMVVLPGGEKNSSVVGKIKSRQGGAVTGSLPLHPAPIVRRRSQRIVALKQGIHTCASSSESNNKSFLYGKTEIKQETVIAEVDPMLFVENCEDLFYDEVMSGIEDRSTKKKGKCLASGLRKTCAEKQHGRKNVINKMGSSASSKKHMPLRTQVSKGFDEFLAKNFKLTCFLCQVPLLDFTSLKRHFRTEHRTRGYAMCCGKKLLKRGVLVDHIQTHLNPEYFKCSTCSKITVSRRSLELHSRLHDQKPERIFQCEICSKSYFRKTVFMRHLQMHVPEDQKTVHCPQCEKVFATTYMMNQHLKLVHLNFYAKICEICGKSIRGRDAFQRHQREHAGVPNPLVQCSICKIKLTNKYGLTRHMKAIHTEENLQPQVCNICSKVSPTVSAHRRHLNYVHNMERKHACQMCEKAFKRTKDLKEHMTVHTGEVLYTCPHCPKTFNSNANMYSHRKKIHPEEWKENRRDCNSQIKSSVLQNNDNLEHKCNSRDQRNPVPTSDEDANAIFHTETANNVEGQSVVIKQN